MAVADTAPWMHDVVHEKLDTMLENVDIGSSVILCGVDKFTCTQCAEKFNDRDALFKHIQMSHQQHVHARRKFKCELCQCTFKSMTGLRNHTRTHTLFYDHNTDRSQTITSSSMQFTSGSVQSDDVNKVRVNNEQRDIFEVSQRNTAITMHTHPDSIGNIVEQSDNNGNTGNQLSRRRRSGIPRPIRRSLIMDNECSYAVVSPDRSTVDENSGITKQSTDTGNNADAGRPSRSTVIRESRRLKGVVTRSRPTKPTQNVDKSKQLGSLFKLNTPRSHHRQPIQKTKTISKASKEMRHMSPFGKHVTTAVNSPVTNANKQTRTLHGGNTNSFCGRRTPLVEKGTPVNSKRTPLSARRNTPRNNAHSCKKCGKAFLDKAKLEVHNTMHSRETGKCRVPKYAVKKNLLAQMNNSSPLQQERKRAHCEKVATCNPCGHMYDTKMYHDAPMKIHAKTPFSCEFCDKQFRYLSSLQAHNFVHKGESRDNTLCARVDVSTTADDNTTGNSRNNFNMFSILASRDNYLEDSVACDIPFTCKSCDYKTRAPADLLSHIKTHSKSGPYTCKHCCKSYSLRANLKMHEKVHTISKLKQMLVHNTVIKIHTS